MHSIVSFGKFFVTESEAEFDHDIYWQSDKYNKATCGSVSGGRSNKGSLSLYGYGDLDIFKNSNLVAPDVEINKMSIYGLKNNKDTFVRQ